MATILGVTGVTGVIPMMTMTAMRAPTITSRWSRTMISQIRMEMTSVAHATQITMGCGITSITVNLYPIPIRQTTIVIVPVMHAKALPRKKRTVWC